MKIQRIALALVLFLSTFAFGYSGGSGTEADPYEIATKQDLLDLGANTDDYEKYFIMTADIDLAGETFTQALIAGDTDTDTGFGGKYFTGSFNGNGHIISNLTVSGSYYCGLFGYIGSGGTVSYLGLKNVSITGTDDRVGGLCGHNSGSVISCNITISVSGHGMVGGLCGSNSGSIADSYAIGSITAKESWGGGLCGYNSGVIAGSYATGTVSANSTVGGLCGHNSGSIIDSYAASSVKGKYYAGGLCGTNSGGIADSYATGYVSGKGRYVGGLCGSNSNSITSSYATGNVSGYEYIGGLCGSTSGSITECYAAGFVIGYDSVGGLCGVNCESNINNCYYNIYAGMNNGYGIPLNDEEFLQKSSFVGFDFAGDDSDGSEDIWDIEPGYMPRLTWQEAPGFTPPHRLENIPTSLSGSGYLDDPFVIGCYEDLIEFRNNSSLRIGYYSLAADIDLAGVIYSEAFIPEFFMGTFLGNSHVISNLVVDGGSHLGFFSHLIGSVEGLGLKNVYVKGTGDFVGGLCGENYYGSIADCYVEGIVSGNRFVGGLCGRSNLSCSIAGCYANSIVSGDKYIGGLCGWNYFVSITSCYTTGFVSGNSCIGGLCGENDNGSITSCYAAGSVTGNGFCGYQYGSVAIIENCFWDVETSGVGSSGDNNYGATGKTTSEMQTQSTFTDAGWDFSDQDGDDADWKMLDSWYPILAWQNSTLVTVPDFTGLTFEQAIVLADSNDITVVIAGYLYSDYDEGLICSQSPAPGVSAISGWLISVYVSLGTHYSGGSGTEADPYQIVTKQDLLDLGDNTDDYDKYFIMTADIDLAGETFSRALIAWNTDENSNFNGTLFTGSFNGNGHVISNLAIIGSDYCGLFGHIGSGGTVSNLGLKNVSITGTEPRVGGLCGMNYGSSITSCYTTGDVSGDFCVGGLCGESWDSSITQCYTTGNVTGTGLDLGGWIRGGNSVGGLCGNIKGSSITSCYATGSVSGNGSVGGLCGDNSDNIITSCYATGSVVGTGSCVGGLCGWNRYGSIISSYATGSVSGGYDYMLGYGSSAGGLCGNNFYGTIINCYATGSVTGTDINVGGFCGYQYGSNSPKIENCFWDVETSGQTIGYNLDSRYPGTITNVQGLTTAEMQTQSTFTDAGWDFSGETNNGTENTWHMPFLTTGYPMLYWQRDIPGDLTGSYGVNIADFAAISDSWLIDYNLSELEILTNFWLEQ